MNRRSLPVAAALATAAALLLTACGGGDDSQSKDPDKIAGADTGAASESASSSPSASKTVGRPEITLPSDLQLTFEGGTTGDAVKDAILADGAERIRAVDALITGTDPKGVGVNFYNTGRALEASITWANEFKVPGLTLTGKARYYKRSVTLEESDMASLSFCADEGKGYTKVTKTGKVNKTPATKNSYVSYVTRLQKSETGVWQTTRIVSQRGAASCQP